MSAPALSLTTDFGSRDGYAGALRGVLAAAVPAIPQFDVSHDIPPQDTLAGAVAVLTACPSFPAGSVHLVVVDPEVGSDRPGLIVAAWNMLFVGPDSGVLHFPLAADGARSWRIDPGLRSDAAGSTFDGRDWFAPTAGRLAAGASPDELGTPTDDVVVLDLPAPAYEPYRWLGHILHVDRFGNLVSDLPAPAPDARQTARVFAGDHPVGPVRRAYADVAENHPVATIGALGTVEVGVNGGSARRRFGARRGDRIELLFPAPQDPPPPAW